jgi:hypothetical protein
MRIFFWKKKKFNNRNKLESVSVIAKTRGNSREVLNFPILQK